MMASRFVLRSLAFAVVALAAHGACLRDAAGASLLPPGTPPIPAGTSLVLEINPYSRVDWTQFSQFKANLHAHTTQSDGSNSPSAVIDMYKAAGYGVLALTEHDRCTWPWMAHGRNPDDMGLVAIAGNELSRNHHVLSLFSDYAPTNAYTLDQALAGIGSTNGLAALCHPATEWSALFAVPSLQVPLTPPLRGVTRGDFTLETWFRTAKVERGILMGNFAKGSTGALNLELQTENVVRVFLLPGNANGEAVDLRASAGDSLGFNTRNGEWHHLAATRVGDVLSLYLNGRLVARQSGATSRFDLQGDFFYIGRDTRLERLDFDGDLDWPRLWARGLSSNDVFRLARGASPGAAEGPTRDGLLFEYGFEKSNDLPTQPGIVETGRVDDTGGHASGPFHARPSETGGGTYILDAPPALARSEPSPRAMRFSFELYLPDPPPRINSNTLEYYLSLYNRYPHLFGIEVASTYSDFALDRELWDLLLERMMPRRPVWGLAVDDLHRSELFDIGWIVLPAPQLSEEVVRQMLQKGMFYFSTTKVFGGQGPDPNQTPRIDRIEHDPAAGEIQIRASVAGHPLPESAYAWISGGRTVHLGSALDYRRVAGIGNYVRAEMTGEGGKTFTNPFGFAPVPAVANLSADGKAPAHPVSRIQITRGLVAYWPLDDGLLDRYATTAQNTQGHSPGRLAGFGALPPWLSGPDARIGGALQLDGIESHVRIPPSDDLDIGTNAVSLSLWVKLSSLPSQLANPFAGIYDSDLESYGLYLDRQAGGIRFKVTDANLHSAAPLIPETQLRTETWHHVVGVYDGSASPAAGQTLIYLDGRLQEERIGSDSSPGHGLTRPVQPGQVAALGRKGSEDKHYWGGAIDDVAIWSRPLSPVEVLHIFENGTRGIPLDR